MTIGIFETGSIKRPRMVISTSTSTSFDCAVLRVGCAVALRFLYHQFAYQAVGKTCCGPHRDVGSYLGSGGFRGGEVQGFVLACAPDALRAGLLPAFHHSF